MDDLHGAKRRLRLEIGARRREVPEDQRIIAGREIARHVLAMREFATASRVAAYAATADEAPLADLLAAVQSSGRTLLLPRIEDGALVFVAVGDLAALSLGPYGLREPTGPPADALADSDLVLVPGVAFDRRGGRLGRGGGFYDRSLPRGPAAPPMFGVALALQLVDRVPTEPHDRRVDGVVTEHGVLRVAPRDPVGDPG